MTQCNATLPEDNGREKRQDNNAATAITTVITRATSTAKLLEKKKETVTPPKVKPRPESAKVISRGKYNAAPKFFAVSASSSTAASHHFPLHHTTIFPYLQQQHSKKTSHHTNMNKNSNFRLVPMTSWDRLIVDWRGWVRSFLNQRWSSPQFAFQLCNFLSLIQRKIPSSNTTTMHYVPGCVIPPLNRTTDVHICRTYREEYYSR